MEPASKGLKMARRTLMAATMEATPKELRRAHRKRMVKPMEPASKGLRMAR